MSRYSLCLIPVKTPYPLMITLLLGLILSLVFDYTVQARPSTQSHLQQFTTAGHIVGFKAEGIYIASNDHMLRVEFAGTEGTVPLANQTPSDDGLTQPLGRVTYHDLWPGISLSYEQVSNGIFQSSYFLQPGADVSQIRLLYNTPVEIGADGSLHIGFESGQMRESAPIAWQDINGQRLPVEISFCLPDSSVHNHVVGFDLAQYNTSYPLMIDPTLSWNTFIGSPFDDIGNGIAVDADGNVYVVGTSLTEWGSPVTPHAGGSYDAFVAKLDSSGVLQWNTFMGSMALDYGNDIVADANGNIFVTGKSNGSWGLPINAHQGGEDAFIARLNSRGERQWNTFIGGVSHDIGNAIILDESRNVYVAGESWDTWGSPVNDFEGGTDAFVAMLNSSGKLQWNTFMGSSGADSGHAIALDPSGNVFTSGTSNVSWGSPVNAHTGGIKDTFVAMLNNGGDLWWNTFMGSANYDYCYAIAVDGDGNIYVAGSSNATWGSPVNPFSNWVGNAFVAGLNNSGVLRWNTFFGGSQARALAVDENGDVYVVGSSSYNWAWPVNSFTGGIETFAARLSNSGALQGITFLGSWGTDVGEGIAIDASKSVYITGYSNNTWGHPVNPFSGPHDAFVAKLPAKENFIWHMLLPSIINNK